MFEHLELILTGFGIVLGVLAMLWGVTSLIGFIFKATAKSDVKSDVEPDAKPAGAKVVPQAAPKAAPSGSSVAAGIPAHHLALIAAAVSALIEGPHRLVNVSAHGSPSRPQLPVWTQQGLFEHFASHRP